MNVRPRKKGRRPSKPTTRDYKFTNKKHPPKAIIALILGTISLIGLCIVIYLTFAAAGVTKHGYGLTGLLAVIYSLVGLILGILSFRDRDSFYVLSWAGTILNAVVLLMVGFIFSLGVR